MTTLIYLFLIARVLFRLVSLLHAQLSVSQLGGLLQLHVECSTSIHCSSEEKRDYCKVLKKNGYCVYCKVIVKHNPK
jgi:hypothetical protein